MIRPTQFIPLKYKQRLAREVCRRRGLRQFRGLYQGNEKKKIFVMGTPEYSNLGDHAIAVSQLRFLKEQFPDYEVIEITNDMFDEHCLAIRRTLNKQDILTVIGGGNFGNEYAEEQRIRLETVRLFPKNRVVIFPQTIYFTPDEAGRKELARTKKLFSRHKDLHIIAREAVSYEFSLQHFPHNCSHLLPDTVLYLQDNRKNKRAGVLLCFRSDRESNLKRQETDLVKRYLEQNSIPFHQTDTVLNYKVSKGERAQQVDAKLDEFSRAALVVTDRLHGMIFSAITKTPCIVFSNYNHKVKGCYQTISQLDYIQYFEQFVFEDFRAAVETALEKYGESRAPINTKQWESELREIVKTGRSGSADR